MPLLASASTITIPESLLQVKYALLFYSRRKLGFNAEALRGITESNLHIYACTLSLIINVL